MVNIEKILFPSCGKIHMEKIKCGIMVKIATDKYRK